MIPGTQVAGNPAEDDMSIKVIKDLLNALVVPVPGDSGEAKKTTDPETSSSTTSSCTSTSSSCSASTSQVYHHPPATRLGPIKSLGQGSLLGRQGLIRNSSSGEFNIQDADDRDGAFQIIERAKFEMGNASPKKGVHEDLSRPLVPRSAILKMLAEAVRSYSNVCKLIIDYNYPANMSELIPEDCSALSFILDHLLQDRPCSKDMDCPNMARMLIAALASCIHSPDTQAILVTEVKNALLRTVAMPESVEKNSQIQQICNLVCVMIDNCPTPNPPQPPTTTPSGKLVGSSVVVNSIVRLMLRKGLIQDLARIPHSLDLSSPNMHVTVNAALKPLEILTRLVNHPILPTPSSKGIKQKVQGPATTETGAQTTGSSTSDATLAQGEEAAEDTENTEHDISAAAEPTSESNNPTETVGLEDIMEQLLEGSSQQDGEQRLSLAAAAAAVVAAAAAVDDEEDIDEELEKDDEIEGDEDEDVDEDEEEDDDDDKDKDDFEAQVNSSSQYSESSDPLGPDHQTLFSEASQDSSCGTTMSVPASTNIDITKENETDSGTPITQSAPAGLPEIVPSEDRPIEQIASCDSDTSTVRAPMETLSIPNSPSSSNAAENLDQDPLMITAPNEVSDDAKETVVVAGSSTRGGASSMPMDMSRSFLNSPNRFPDSASRGNVDQLPRNVFEELDLDAAESWFRSQMEVQPRLSPTHSDGDGTNQDQSSSTFADGSTSDAATVHTGSSAPATSSNVEVPDGVDPSFLAALPQEMRQEVIAEQLRLQRLQQRAHTAHPTATTEPATTANTLGGNPEFLAALLPNMQEGVLNQQRLEQQRQAAASDNAAAAVAFFPELIQALQQAMFTDLEESPSSVLPPDLAAEAQSLRRDWEARNRQIMQEPLFSHVGHGSSALSSILRNPGCMAGRYAIHSVPQRHGGWGGWGRANPNGVIPGAKYKGRLVLDQEALSCLLVLLFVDDPKLNITRLQRVLRNLCYHPATRDWVFKALTSIVDKCNECHSPDMSSLVAQQGGHTVIESCPTTQKLTVRQSFSSPDSSPRCDTKVPQPSWLNITIDAALGSRANVFYVQRPTGERGTDRQGAPQVIIHPQAASTVAKHVLEAMVSLAKVFATFYVPHKPKEDKKEQVKPGTSSGLAFSSSGTKAKQFDSDFWDVLLKLDLMSSTKKGKTVLRTHLNSGSEQDPASLCLNMESYNFQHLMTMLSYPLIKRSTHLTDRMLRVLNVAAQGLTEEPSIRATIIPEGGSKNAPTSTSTSSMPDVSTLPPTLPATPAPSPAATATPVGHSRRRPFVPKHETILEIPENHLRLAIDVLTSKSCSEDGLDDATAFLMNLSSGPIATRDMIYKQLLEGAKQLGAVVCQHIALLMQELRGMNRELRKDKSNEVEEEENLHPDRAQKGKLQDRFTNATVVVTAPNKVKGGCELQLPSMAALTTKASSQAFFLRILKVILQLRDTMKPTIKKPIKKKTPEPSPQTVGAEGDILPSGDAPSEAAAPLTSSQCDTGSSQGEQLNSASSQEQNAIQQESMDTCPSGGATDGGLPFLSEQLIVEHLWSTLSQCLLELEHTPDHYAVLVLQPAVEAFFLVHASSIEKEAREDTSSSGGGSQSSRRAPEANPAAGEANNQELAPVSPLPGERDASSSSASSSSSSSSVQPASTASPHLNITLDTSPPVVLSPDTRKFLKFAEMHRTVLNQILRQSTIHLADGPFAVLVDHTRMLDFDVKRRYFRIELDRLDEGIRREELAVHVRRSHVFEDSFRELHRRSADEWKNRFYIVFEGEEGQDAGGLLREWYVIISREIFNPMYALFTTSPGDRVTYMINSTSHCNPNHLSYFKFVGRVIAKAIYDNKLLECYFTRSFYKHILGILVKYTDMESEDYSFYKGLVYLMEHDVVDLGYDLTFSTEVQEFGVTEVRDLIPNGRNIAVTEANKMDYVRLVCQMKMTGAIRKQLNAFLEGFYNIIPKRLISIFNEQELELLISGLPNVDIEDLKANTEYHKYQSTSLQIQWFWRALQSLDQADRAKFLQFVTGTSKVSLQGFGALEGMNGVQKFQIHRDDRSTDRLPSAHTCFNQLDLPVYETYDKLRSYLLKAIHECSEGFGFA